jgi:hypothetical protein
MTRSCNLRLFHPTTFVTLLLGATLAAAGCGDDDDDAAIDAAPSDASHADGGTVDANGADAFTPVTNPSCDELTTPAATLSTFPGTFEGTLAGAEGNLDITETAECAVSYGEQFGKGPDQVIALTGLTAGKRYYAKLTSPGDLDVYVITGCDAAAPGPAADQCLGFSDRFYGDSTEVVDFTAPEDGKAYVVVDYFSDTEAPEAFTYDLEVTDLGCVSDKDCGTPELPICTDGGVCGTVDYCEGDDAAEGQSDDTIFGATAVTLGETPVSIDAHICGDSSQSAEELDFYKVTVPVGGAFQVDLGWLDTSDIDIVIIDADGNLLAESFYLNPETSSVTYLVAGDYYVRVTRYFGPEGVDPTVVTPYTITFTRLPVALCTTVADCTGAYQHEYFRASCSAAGACVELQGAGQVALGDVCDSDDDCGGTADLCTNASFTAHADTHSICSKNCTGDGDCAAVDATARCTDGFGTNACLMPCASDEDCPILNGTPAPGQPWKHSTCIVAEGRCKFPE